MTSSPDQSSSILPLVSLTAMAPVPYDEDRNTMSSITMGVAALTDALLRALQRLS